MCADVAFASQYLAQSVERIVRDVEGVSSYQGLMVQQDDYVLETTGVSVKLINLTGTIPIMFRQSVYNIPVKIWLPPMYPRDAPLAYVQPTSTMLVKQGKHVDPSGKVYLPYLHYWPNRSDVRCIAVRIGLQSVKRPLLCISKHR